MRKIFTLQILLIVSVFANVTLTLEEQKNWNIKTSSAKEVSYVPLGEYMVDATIPPTLLHTVSLPYEVQVVKLEKVDYERVEKGETLAVITAREWIEAQRKVIADAIELIHHEHFAERKSKLCKEEIIAQKECITAEAEVKTDKIKLVASKALLNAYGANDAMIQKIYSDLTILPNLKLLSPVEGNILQVNIQPGKSISSSSALFVIKVDGQNWLESDLPEKIADQLTLREELIITIEGKVMEANVEHISPIFNHTNQTRHVRFSINKDAEFLAGLRKKALISIKKKAFLIDKKAVVQDEGSSYIFLKKENDFIRKKVDILSEDTKTCYLNYDTALNEQIVINATSILQNMVQEEK